MLTGRQNIYCLTLLNMYQTSLFDKHLSFTKVIV